MINKTCLVTGGLGYIGSHICIELLESNYNLIIVDNLSNSKIEKLDRIKKFNIHNKKIYFFNFDLVNFDKLLNCIKNVYLELDLSIGIIIHLAGYKAVGESIEYPILYYENNLISTINLTKIMEIYKIKNLIFSSSSTVYGCGNVPLTEKSPTGLGITNPYGRTKFIQEEMLKDIMVSKPDWNIILLRYFNPVGHLNNELKEEPSGIPNNLFPYLLKVYNGELEGLTVFGSDYGTRDGTCSRDFIHVVDLGSAHTICCENLIRRNITGLKIYNVGTGTDTTVLELIKAFETVNNTKIQYKFGSRRSGDLESSYCNVDLIKKELGWVAKYTIEDCVKIE
jgi:UDP-glucose 4-epimerase